MRRLPDFNNLGGSNEETIMQLGRWVDALDYFLDGKMPSDNEVVKWLLEMGCSELDDYEVVS